MGKVLIVDDVPKNIQMAMNILKHEGHELLYAKSGSKALDLVKEHDFDLILLDIMMPMMNGFEVCAMLKQDHSTKCIPIIFLSGKDSSSDIEQAYENGGSDYVIKPFINIELINKVNIHVKLKQYEEGNNKECK
jgi:putative two-component system response regulator